MVNNTRKVSRVQAKEQSFSLKKLVAFGGALMLLVQLLAPVAPAFAASGAIWTTTSSCGEDPQNENAYAVGDNVYINYDNFEEGSEDWEIKGQPGGASSDPNIVVASGTEVIDESGSGCFLAYTVLPGDDGVYKASLGGKNDNYHVGEEEEVNPCDPEEGPLEVRLNVALDLPEECLGTLIVEKVTDVETDFSNFSFSVNGEATAFESDGTNEFTLVAGSYTVVETNIPEGWALDDVTCHYEEASVGLEVENGKTIELVAGETVHCTFSNVTEDVPDDSTTIEASKVVCLTEADLPNWGALGLQAGEPIQITSTTAAEFVADSNERCWLEEDWSFQWGFSEKDNQSGVNALPGDHIGQADGTSTLGQCPPTHCGNNTQTGTDYNDWKDFDTSTSANGVVTAKVHIEDLEGAPGIWVRENLQEGYVPFSYPPDPAPGSNVSAELYCHTDIQNYDNYDEIQYPSLGNTYHCVAFNALEGVTIEAAKIVCLHESDLPNWGAVGLQGGEPTQITATTAQEYVAANPQSCWLEEDWSFQWGFSEKDGQSGVNVLPGDHIGQADGTSTLGMCPPTYCHNNTFTGTDYNDWKDFDTFTSANGAVSAMVNVTDLEGAPGIWVRENLQPGYVPFTYPPDPSPGSNVSAELYCHTDIQNYDNYDEIQFPTVGNTYYCVAFNAIEEVTIEASKIVCLNEADLPNWGAVGLQAGEPTQITATTAAEYVAANPNSCHLEPNWSFQWGFSEKDGQSGVNVLPGDHIGQADGTSTLGQCPPTYCGNNTFTGAGYADWKNFDTFTTNGGVVTAKAYISDLQGAPGIWVRENLQPGYVPFTYPPDPSPGSNVSAELYCHTDIQNYDNYDEIQFPTVGNTYYCVAFNAIEEEGGQGGSSDTFRLEGEVFNDVNISGTWDKEAVGEDQEVSLSGWTIFIDENDNNILDGSEVSDTTASPYVFSNLSNGTYKVVIVSQNGWAHTTPISLSVIINNANSFNNDFGVVQSEQGGCIADCGGGGGGGTSSTTSTGGGGGGGGPVPPTDLLNPTILGANTDAGGTPEEGKILGAELPRTGFALSWMLLPMIALAPLFGGLKEEKKPSIKRKSRVVRRTV